MGQATISRELDIVLFCAQQGWTYEQYLAAPKWFVERLKMKLIEDSKANNKK